MAIVALAVPMVVLRLFVALARRVVVTVGVDEHSVVVEIARHTRRWRVVGLLLGAAAAVLALPRGRAVVLAVSTVLLVGALAVGATWGSADDLGRAGRVFSRLCTVADPVGGAVMTGSSCGPWPGSFYAMPLGIACWCSPRWSAGNVLTPTIRVDDLPRPLPGEAAPVGAPVR